MPTEVTITKDRINFIILIWVGRKTRFEFVPERDGPVVGEDEGAQRKNQWRAFTLYIRDFRT